MSTFGAPWQQRNERDLSSPRQQAVTHVRHLATEAGPTTWLDRHELAAWLDAEGARGIRAGAAPSPHLIDIVAGSRHLLVSPVTRAQATADAVLSQIPAKARPGVATVEELIEAPLPVVPIPRLRLPLHAWGNLFRAGWFLGFAGEVESHRVAVVRARSIARRLGDLAPSGPVTMIAHGITNLLVARELRRLGWNGPRLPDHRHGGTATFRRRDLLLPVAGADDNHPPNSS